MKLFDFSSDFAFSRRQRVILLSLTLIAMFIITPLCGFIFDCGCTWPGFGLDSRCNYYVPNAIHRCPWCTSLIAGGISFLIALFVGMWGAIKLPVSRLQGIKGIFSPLLHGVVFFIMVAVSAGVVSAWIQDYPLAVFKLAGK